MPFAIRELSPPRLGPAVRLFAARRPWLRWVVITALAAWCGFVVHGRLGSIEAARTEWSERITVPVAVNPARPGEPLEWDWRELPAIAVPDDVVHAVPDDPEARRHVGRGEILVDADLVDGPGPAGGADPGEVVVPVSDPLVSRPEVGVAVAVYADGLVLAPSARIVRVDADVVFVAVAADEAPMIAAAAQTRQASLAFIAPG